METAAVFQRGGADDIVVGPWRLMHSVGDKRKSGSWLAMEILLSANDYATRPGSPVWSPAAATGHCQLAERHPASADSTGEPEQGCARHTGFDARDGTIETTIQPAAWAD